MQKVWLIVLSLVLSACAQDPYRLKISNNLSNDHGKSVYYRSNMRSNYASQIRHTLSQKFGEMGLRPSVTAEGADLIAIFDVETFYPQTETYKNTSYANTMSDSVLFTTDEDATSLDYTGNTDVQVNHDKTCFTMKIGPKNTSQVKYNSTFCANTVMETEEMLPRILDIYSKYATYQAADVGVQCLTDASGQNVSCDQLHDRQQAFINSLWIDKEITDD